MTQSNELIFPFKMVMFHSYVSLPEGTRSVFLTFTMSNFGLESLLGQILSFANIHRDIAVSLFFANYIVLSAKTRSEYSKCVRLKVLLFGCSK